MPVFNPNPGTLRCARKQTELQSHTDWVSCLNSIYSANLKEHNSI
jgi:hypothetical protein